MELSTIDWDFYGPAKCDGVAGILGQVQESEFFCMIRLVCLVSLNSAVCWVVVIWSCTRKAMTTVGRMIHWTEGVPLC